MSHVHLSATHKAPSANVAITPIFCVVLIRSPNIWTPDEWPQKFNITQIDMRKCKEVWRTIGIGMAIMMRSMMQSDSANAFSNGIVAKHLVRSVLTEIHHAAKSPLQANRNAKKNATVQINISMIMTRLTTPNEVNLLIEKIRRKRNTKLSFTRPNWRTCINWIAHSS